MVTCQYQPPPWPSSTPSIGRPADGAQIQTQTQTQTAAKGSGEQEWFKSIPRLRSIVETLEGEMTSLRADLESARGEGSQARVNKIEKKIVER